MSTLKLTKRVVDGAELRPARYTLFDSEIRGFGLRVFPSGQKSYVLEYKSGDGGRRAVTKRITIGKSSEFTPDEARRIADRLRSRAKIGQDPQKEKSEYRKAASVTDMAEQFLRGHVETKRKPTTKSFYEGILRRVVVPAFGNRKASELTRADLARVHLELSTKPILANRVLAIVGSMYAFAGKHGLVTEGFNPAHGIEKYKETARERLLSVEELERLGASIRVAETVGIPWEIDSTKESKHVPKVKRETVVSEHAAAALRLLIFTGARLREILHLKWAHVDFDRGLLLLPDSKTGQKAIVLNAPALSVLTNLTRVGAYVIAGDRAGSKDEKPRSDLKRPWDMIRRHAKLEGLRIHDLRHNFASFGVGGGMGLPIIGKLLGHTQAATTQRYAHLDADPLRRASNAIGNTIAAAMGEPVATSADVIPLKPRKR